MKEKMRFENGGNFIEIAAGMAKYDDEVWIVESNIDFKELPVEFRVQLRDTDEAGFEKLKQGVCKLNCVTAF